MIRHAQVCIPALRATRAWIVCSGTLNAGIDRTSVWLYETKVDSEDAYLGYDWGKATIATLLLVKTPFLIAVQKARASITGDFRSVIRHAQVCIAYLGYDYYGFFSDTSYQLTLDSEYIAQPGDSCDT